MTRGAIASIQPGELRKRIRIQQNAAVQTPDGGTAENWVDFVTRWAAIGPLGGRELAAAAQVYPEANSLITLRWFPGAELLRPGVAPDMRILYGARQFDIVNVNDVEERHQELRIVAIERPEGRNA
jgi:SPP1 family predicted phage head-tail adaptor